MWLLGRNNQKIEQCFAECEKNRENESIYSYLIDRAQIQIAEEELLKLRQKEKAEAEKLLNIQENLKMESENVQILRRQYEELNIQLRNDETERRLKEIEKRVAELRQSIRRVQDEYDRERAKFEQIRSHFYRAGNELLSRVERINPDDLDPTAAVHLDSLAESVEMLRQTFAKTEDLPPEKVTEAAQGGVLLSVILTILVFSLRSW